MGDQEILASNSKPKPTSDHVVSPFGYSEDMLQNAQYVCMSSLAVSKDASFVIILRQFLSLCIEVHGDACEVFNNVRDQLEGCISTPDDGLFDGGRCGNFDVTEPVQELREHHQAYITQLHSFLKDDFHSEMMETEEELYKTDNTHEATVVSDDLNCNSGGEQIEKKNHKLPPKPIVRVLEANSPDGNFVVEIRLPRLYSSLLVFLNILTFFLNALLMINQHLKLWPMIDRAFPPLLFVILPLQLCQFGILIAAIRVLLKIERKPLRYRGEHILPYAPLSLFLILSQVILVTFELCSLKNHWDALFALWMAMPLLVLAALNFAVVGLWSTWGFRYNTYMAPDRRGTVTELLLLKDKLVNEGNNPVALKQKDVCMRLGQELLVCAERFGNSASSRLHYLERSLAEIKVTSVQKSNSDGFKELQQRCRDTLVLLDNLCEVADTTKLRLDNIFQCSADPQPSWAVKEAFDFASKSKEPNLVENFGFSDYKFYFADEYC